MSASAAEWRFAFGDSSRPTLRPTLRDALLAGGEAPLLTSFHREDRRWKQDAQLDASDLLRRVAVENWDRCDACWSAAANEMPSLGVAALDALLAWWSEASDTGTAARRVALCGIAARERADTIAAQPAAAPEDPLIYHHLARMCVPDPVVAAQAALAATLAVAAAVGVGPREHIEGWQEDRLRFLLVLGPDLGVALPPTDGLRPDLAVRAHILARKYLVGHAPLYPAEAA